MFFESTNAESRLYPQFAQYWYLSVQILRHRIRTKLNLHHSAIHPFSDDSISSGLTPTIIQLDKYAE